MLKDLRTKLLKWYQNNKRGLPWRQKKDPYKIWISEVMLQQTTVNAVIPYYRKFIKKFNTLQSLAKAPLEEVLEYWSGLGYYSRAKNLHKASKKIHTQKYFPKTYKELIKLPGFGPYTARAVSSLAFNEQTGVLDANVIRVLSRFYGLSFPWWQSKNQKNLQSLADKWAKLQSSLVNQALMELGSLICHHKAPLCPACPLNNKCKAYKTRQTNTIPLKKPKTKKEIWLYQPVVFIKNKQTALVKNHQLPVLKGEFAFPGPALKKNKTPKNYDFIHSITHHAIYVKADFKYTRPAKNLTWINIPEIKKKSPSSLIQKILSARPEL